MLVQALIGELQHEAENTRKLFDAIPDDVLDYKPNDFNWTLAELASHIAEIYSWWNVTLHQDEFKLDEHQQEKEDISSMNSLKAKLEKNIALAMETLENYPEEKLFMDWKMTQGGNPIVGPMPRIAVIRGFLNSHLYHHRGEMIAYLRVNHKPVPGLYGPSYEETKAAM